jgi:hypothetical protein
MRIAALAVCLCAIGLVRSAGADNAGAPAASSSQRIKGKIDAYDPVSRTLSVITSGKKTVSVMLEPDLRVIYDAKRTLNDIKAGDFIGSATLRSGDGTLRAQEVHIFPDSMRGAGEGQHTNSDANPNRTVTNATVTEVKDVAANKGSITVSYRGSAAGPDGSCTGRAGSGTSCTGEAEIQIVPGIPIIALVLGDESLLLPGAAVSVSAISTTEGALASSRLTVEKDGVRPIL